MMITLEEAKEHLRIDHNGMDTDVMLKMKAAEARILLHLQGIDPSTLDDGQIALVKAAILNLLGYLDRVRAEEEIADRFWLPSSVHLLLIPLRNLSMV